jgi:hypothetical protein
MMPIFLRVFVGFIVFACISPFARGQQTGHVLDDTDYGKSMNTAEDLANSLIPARPNLTKGEKKQEVDPKTLPSKPAKDPMFQGGLMDVGLDWGSEKMGKPHSASSETDSKAQKKTETTAANESKAAKQSAGALDKESRTSNSAGAADAQAKKQTKTAAADSKSSEKASANKTDDNR